MIILVQFLSIIIFQLLRSRKRIKFLQKVQENKANMENNSAKHLNVRYNLKFDPPLYLQRYGKVYDTLLKETWRKKIKKLVDFGCSDFKIFVYLKRLTSVNHIFFVDISECTLRKYTSKLQPLTIEYLNRREEPLDVSIFAGSVGDPDYRLLDTDAVTAVELIEHLYPDVLDAFPYNVFNFIEPKLVIITTPNSEFNVLFNKKTKFRNSDHKFEWSREQFETWATNITVRFPDYTVSFSGLGEGPVGKEYLGLCTQVAVFIRKDVLDEGYVSKSYAASCLCGSDFPCKGLMAASKMLCNCTCPLCSPSASYGICTYKSCSEQIMKYEIDEDDDQNPNPSYNIYYKFIQQIRYPFENDPRSEEEKIMDEFKYRINLFGQVNGRFFVEERNRSEIPLQDIIYGSDGISITESEAYKLLTKHGYEIEECRIQETGLYENCVIYEPVMEEISNTSEASGYDSDCTKYQLNEESISDWDDTEKKKSGETPRNNKGITVDYNGFPNWLLQILGSQNIIEEVPPPGSQEEPHFYCQGDGLGVHPSVIAVEIDDDEDSSESSNNTTEFAEVDQGVSSQDMSSLPEDPQGNAQETQNVLLETDTEETEEAAVGPPASEHGELPNPNPGSGKGTN